MPKVLTSAQSISFRDQGWVGRSKSAKKRQMATLLQRVERFERENPDENR